MIIGIDFDGTCVSHEFPLVGNDIGAVSVLKDIVESGNSLILWTMRSDNNKGLFLAAAVKWFSDNDIPLWGIQRNPSQDSWTSSPKAYCEMYIDDAALGCPLRTDLVISSRPFVDWEEVRKILTNQGVIKIKGAQ